MTTDPWAWGLALGGLGLVFGSFIATLALRWPEGRGIARGRSACDGCGAALRAHELVPLLSYALQRGRCRRCGAAISSVHPAIEALAAAVGLAAGLAAPGWAGVAGAAFGWQLLALGAIDLRAFWLPDRLTAALAASGLAAGLAGLAPDLGQRLIGGAGGFLSLWAVARVYRALKGFDGLGGGDPKLFGAIGLWLGWHALPATLLLACTIGIVAVLALRLCGRRMGATDRLPLGTLLAIGGFAAWLAVAAGVRL